MQELLAALLAAGGPSRLDARDHHRLHDALVQLWESDEVDPADREALPLTTPIPDPEVRLRVRGVTRALWSLRACGALRVEKSAYGAHYLVNRAVVENCMPPRSALSERTWKEVQRRALTWSMEVETDLKKSCHSF